jgi:hypothetical protein
VQQQQWHHEQSSSYRLLQRSREEARRGRVDRRIEVRKPKRKKKAGWRCVVGLFVLDHVLGNAKMRLLFHIKRGNDDIFVRVCDFFIGFSLIICHLFKLDSCWGKKQVFGTTKIMLLVLFVKMVRLLLASFWNVTRNLLEVGSER